MHSAQAVERATVAIGETVRAHCGTTCASVSQLSCSERLGAKIVHAWRLVERLMESGSRSGRYGRISVMGAWVATQ